MDIIFLLHYSIRLYIIGSKVYAYYKNGVNNTGLHFLNFFKFQEEDLIILVAFFPDDYEYLNHFLPARQYLPKFHVKSLKFTLNGCF